MFLSIIFNVMGPTVSNEVYNTFSNQNKYFYQFNQFFYKYMNIYMFLGVPLSAFVTFIMFYKKKFNFAERAPVHRSGQGNRVGRGFHARPRTHRARRGARHVDGAGRHPRRALRAGETRSVQHHLFERHDRHPQGHRPFAPDALAAVCRDRASFRAPGGRCRQPRLHAALFEHHDGRVPGAAAGGRDGAGDGQVRHQALARAMPQADRTDGDDAGAGPVPAIDGRADVRRLRPVGAAGSSTAPPRRFRPSSSGRCCARMPGALAEIYSMTEGGVVCILRAHEFPDKLHTVGRPAPGSELKVLDDEDDAVAAGHARAISSAGRAR